MPVAALIPLELIVTPVPITVLVNVGSFVHVIVARLHQMLYAVKFPLTKLISPTLLLSEDPPSTQIITST